MRAPLLMLALLVLAAGGMARQGNDELRQMAVRAAREAGIQPALLLSVGEQESEHRANPPRRAGDGTGPMQIKPGTWAWYGCTGARGIAWHEYRCGARILAALLARYDNNACLAVQAYRDGSARRPCPRKGSYAEQVLWRVQHWEMQAAVKGPPRMIPHNGG